MWQVLPQAVADDADYCTASTNSAENVAIAMTGATCSSPSRSDRKYTGPKKRSTRRSKTRPLREPRVGQATTHCDEQDTASNPVEHAVYKHRKGARFCHFGRRIARGRHQSHGYARANSRDESCDHPRQNSDRRPSVALARRAARAIYSRSRASLHRRSVRLPAPRLLVREASATQALTAGVLRVEQRGQLVGLEDPRHEHARIWCEPSDIARERVRVDPP